VSLFRFFEWLGNTSWSVAFHESRYVFLLVLMIHVLTLSVFVGTALMIDLRLLGKGHGDPCTLALPAGERVDRTVGH